MNTRDLCRTKLLPLGKCSVTLQFKYFSKVVLSHLTQRVDSTDYEPWAEEVRKHFSGEVVIAEDLMEF